MNQKTFATAISCMDGRVQIPVIEYIKQHYTVDYVDMITEAGPEKILSENKETTIIESIKRRVKISAEKHYSIVLAVAGHYGCAGNPADEKIQREQLFHALKSIKSWGMDFLIIAGLWVDEVFKVYEITGEKT